jgi:hypothetical protein
LVFLCFGRQMRQVKSCNSDLKPLKSFDFIGFFVNKVIFALPPSVR